MDEPAGVHRVSDNAAMTARVVAFLDVLGFSAQARSQSHEELVETYKALIGAAYENTVITRVPDDHRKRDSEAFYYPWEETKQPYVHMAMASDSIVVFSQDASRNSAGAVVGSTYRLLRAGFRLGMPLRGGISIGELDVAHADDVAERSAWTAMVGGIVGIGLVEAHELERDFQWSGVVLDTAVREVLSAELREILGDAFDDFDATDAIPLVAPYPAPHRNPSMTVDCWVVDWPAQLDDGLPPLTREQVREAFERHGRSIAEPSAQAKHDHTLAFWDARHQ